MIPDRLLCSLLRTADNKLRQRSPLQISGTLKELLLFRANARFQPCHLRLAADCCFGRLFPGNWHNRSPINHHLFISYGILPYIAIIHGKNNRAVLGPFGVSRKSFAAHLGWTYARLFMADR
jgi:hypothetical protein